MALGRDGEDELLQAAVLEQLLDEEYEKAEPAFMRLIELFSGSRNDRRVMASLLLLYRFLRNHPFYRDWAAEYITADTETPLDETIWSGLLRQRAAEALQYADDLLRDCMDLLGQSNDEMLWEVVTPVIMQDREMLARLMTAVTQEEWDIAMTRMLEASFPQFPRKKWTDAETKDTVLRLRRRAAEAVTELKTKVFLMGETQYREDQQKLAPLMERLCALILEFDSRYAAAKLERRKLDFGDLEHDALALLARPDGTPTALAAELGSRYAEIMLDEYQDTNALQEKIADAVISGGPPANEAIRSLMIANLPECVALPLDHPYANNDILDMRDLKNEKFIAMARSISCSGFESIIQKSLAAGFEAQIVAQVDLLPTLMTMVACGQGISILHRDMLPRSNGRIAFVPLRSVSYFRRWLMWDINNDNPCLQPLIALGHKWQDDLEYPVE